MSPADRSCPSCDTPLPPEANFCLHCGAATQADGRHPTVISPDGEHLLRLKQALAAHYHIDRVLGRGGMATVYLADDVRHGRQVAVKVLHPELAAVVGSDRFLREIRIVARFQHPHILTLIDSGKEDGFLYYVMPFVDGESLRETLRREHELPIGDAVGVLRDVADALAHAHSQGIVHRDIKPGNVLVSGRHALVVDFGVAKAVSQAADGGPEPTMAGLSLGTPMYMAPEQATGDPDTDHRADIYAVGALAYELLAGRPPFRGETRRAVLAAQVTRAPTPIDELRPTVPPPLAHLVMRCLEKRPADRWQTADELLRQLEAVSTAGAWTTLSSTPPVGAARQRPAHRLWLGAAAVVIAAAAVGTVMTFGGGREDGLPQPGSRQLTFDGNIGSLAPEEGEPATPGLWVISPADSTETLVGEGTWSPVEWGADGQSAYARGYRDNKNLRRFSLTGDGHQVAPPSYVGDAECIPHERGDVLIWICLQSVRSSDVWMIENFDPAVR